ncbi:unnamed protein product [marine sediment metagenome]|uniref:Uncharacterized protein n=1 Tax=marine sediment metagenome TaxID=412755 RepID=X1RP31_9ZZZZ
MERKELFSAARNEKGKLEIYFPDSDEATSLNKKFWKMIKKEVERCLEAHEIIDIIEDCLKNWK